MGPASSKPCRFRPLPSPDVSKVTRLPQELLDEIMGYLADDYASLRRCSMAAGIFVPSCRRYLFRRVVFRSHNLPTWKSTFPDPSTTPATYTREIRIHLAPDTPTKLAEYMPYFSNVRDLTLIGGRCETHEWVSNIGRLPASIRSLTMKFVSVTNAQVLGIMGQLPNLDDFSLFTFKGSGFPDGAGEILRGRYGGKLELLLMDDFHASVVRSLLQAPEGLGFKSVKAFCNAGDDFSVYADLVAACQETLTNLDISVSAEGNTLSETVLVPMRVLTTPVAIIIPGKDARTLDLSRHNSLEHLSFSLLSNFASCCWLSAALSTVDPANSPQLSTVTVYLYRHVPPARVVSETMLGDAAMKDLRDVGTEVKRIRDKSGGRVAFEVVIPLSWVMKPIQIAWSGALDYCSFRVEY